MPLFSHNFHFRRAAHCAQLMNVVSQTTDSSMVARMQRDRRCLPDYRRCRASIGELPLCSPPVESQHVPNSPEICVQHERTRCIRSHLMVSPQDDREDDVYFCLKSLKRKLVNSRAKVEEAHARRAASALLKPYEDANPTFKACTPSSQVKVLRKQEKLADNGGNLGTHEIQVDFSPRKGSPRRLSGRLPSFLEGLSLGSEMNVSNHTIDQPEKIKSAQCRNRSLVQEGADLSTLDGPTSYKELQSKQTRGPTEVRSLKIPIVDGTERAKSGSMSGPIPKNPSNDLLLYYSPFEQYSSASARRRATATATVSTVPESDTDTASFQDSSSESWCFSREIAVDFSPVLRLPRRLSNEGPVAVKEMLGLTGLDVLFANRNRVGKAGSTSLSSMTRDLILASMSAQKESGIPFLCQTENKWVRRLVRTETRANLMGSNDRPSSTALLSARSDDSIYKAIPSASALERQESSSSVTSGCEANGDPFPMCLALSKGTSIDTTKEELSHRSGSNRPSKLMEISVDFSALRAAAGTNYEQSDSSHQTVFTTNDELEHTLERHRTGSPDLHEESLVMILMDLRGLSSTARVRLFATRRSIDPENSRRRVLPSLAEPCLSTGTEEQAATPALTTTFPPGVESNEQVDIGKARNDDADCAKKTPTFAHTQIHPFAKQKSNRALAKTISWFSSHAKSQHVCGMWIPTHI